MNKIREQDYHKGFDLKIWNKLLCFTKIYKKNLIAIGIMMVILAGIDVVFPMLTKYAIDSFIVPKKLEGLKGFILGYSLLVIFQSVVVWKFIEEAARVDMGICYDIRKAGFKRLQELSFSYFDRTHIGWIMARMTSDTSRLGDTIAWGLVDLIWGIAVMIAISCVMLYMNWKLALIVLTVVPFLAIISVFFQKKILNAFREVRKTNSRITGGFNEGIMGAKTTKTLVRESKNLEEFSHITSEMYSSSVKAAIFSSMYLPVVITLGSIGTALALWRGGEGVVFGDLSYGTLVAFITFTIQFFEPVRELARIFAELQSAQASAERIISMIETEPDIKDDSEIIRIYGDVFRPRRENWGNIKGDITFKNVSFAYKEGEKVLDSFNLNVKAGETIALVGETGSGKSTIVNLACRFYEPTEGEILIDGVNYQERSLLWLHSNLGYVLQTPHLFSGTIRENILYGRLDATDEEVIRAAKLVNAHDFIIKMKKGYDTEVGEEGGRLSTGEKQLISFARAILANPRIFILDEATSSVDTETEQLIQNAIRKVLKGRTSFIIAHRLSTIRMADRILVINKGKVGFVNLI
ncbi:ABC transporter ATP-binding protein [Paramaledivibacter caminithermalis]|uniref:ATP-binding cassette, subfamily B n=1 Tax=Paramaledivibacter caminithermalis (strain DSM 15212 / CIP 107654 / DViRD3) TaxID=1121301 RepID=A0A1M6MU21_PARC5|nr:ABC transporter ATP-binding protein [Paramaledivibacter caminithermalis]SHJ86954.1 ATP-binding cassette, subfamily B [Paramaledivibacter caminithermalis DSM 15212]